MIIKKTEAFLKDLDSIKETIIKIRIMIAIKALREDAGKLDIKPIVGSKEKFFELRLLSINYRIYFREWNFKGKDCYVLLRLRPKKSQTNDIHIIDKIIGNFKKKYGEQ
jgi:putative component of toxin-antitoxin plasmid stabilization module